MNDKELLIFPLISAIARVIVVACFALVILTFLIHSALSCIYAAALYRYASGGEETAGDDSGAMKLAFLPKP